MKEVKEVEEVEVEVVTGLPVSDLVHLTKLLALPLDLAVVLVLADEHRLLHAHQRRAEQVAEEGLEHGCPATRTTVAKVARETMFEKAREVFPADAPG